VVLLIPEKPLPKSGALRAIETVERGTTGDEKPTATCSKLTKVVGPAAAKNEAWAALEFGRVTGGGAIVRSDENGN